MGNIINFDALDIALLISLGIIIVLGIFFIEIDSRVFDNVFFAATTHLIKLLVKDDRGEESDEFIDGFAFVQGKKSSVATFHQVGKIGFGDFGEEFVLGIMVMDAITEEHPFGIDQEILVVGTFTVALIGIQHRLNGFADAEVVLEVLVEEDVATATGSLAEVIDIGLLL